VESMNRNFTRSPHRRRTHRCRNSHWSPFPCRTAPVDRARTASVPDGRCWPRPSGIGADVRSGRRRSGVSVSRWSSSLAPGVGSRTGPDSAPVTSEKSPPALPSELAEWHVDLPVDHGRILTKVVQSLGSTSICALGGIRTPNLLIRSAPRGRFKRSRQVLIRLKCAVQMGWYPRTAKSAGTRCYVLGPDCWFFSWLFSFLAGMRIRRF
jgi:hypothetical protein